MHRGRRRRRNTSDASASSRVSTRSSSGQGTNAHGSSGNLLRRSSRIAERSSTTELNSSPNTDDTMAYVARRTQTNDNLGARVVEDVGRRRIRIDGENAGVRTLNSRAGQSIQNSVGRSGAYDASGYVMDVVAQPPRSARPGQALRATVTIRLRRSHAAPDSDLEDGRLLVVATLVTRGADGADVPVGPDALTGPRLFDNIHPVEEDSEGVVGYASFPDLAIRHEGMYKIRIALIRVNGTHGETMQIVDTQSIVVGRT